ncbi:MAG: 2-amino-4-hydroxy-6-hydroxymethyldihydropteridine diphosphokinase [bacterium]
MKKTNKKIVIKTKSAPESQDKGSNEIQGSAKVAYLGLGSNVGDREEYIQQALYLLEKAPGTQVTKVSSIYETEPEGDSEQPMFLNAACRIKTTLSPRGLMEELTSIEDTLGRDRAVEWGPRTIDVDILLYEDLIIAEEDLQVPHPLMHERAFVLSPLSEIAPEVAHPALELTIEQLYEDCGKEYAERYDSGLRTEFGRLKDNFRGEIKDTSFE